VVVIALSVAFRSWTKTFLPFLFFIEYTGISWLWGKSTAHYTVLAKRKGKQIEKINKRQQQRNIRNRFKAARWWNDKKDEKESGSVGRGTEQKPGEDEKREVEENEVVVTSSMASGEELV
jgi:hypothetical protein